MIGKTISYYEIVEKLGVGGMGVVYKANDTKLKRTVALKFLPPQLSSDPEAKERFIHEAQAASALDHPNICTIHEIGETDDGESYIAMACYDGMSLKLKIEDCRLKIDESINIAIQIAKGLQMAHEKGIVHRDIKPANIMITDDGTAKILDFGLAKLTGQTRLTKTGSTVGTAAYMSPEQAKGEMIDQRTDIWSLGVVMYEMLTGKLPFVAEYEQAMIYSIINEEPLQVSVLNEDVSAELEQIVNKCLAKDPDERYQMIDDLLADFKGVSKELDISFDESLPKLLQRMWRKKIVRRILAAAAMMVMMGVVYLLLLQKIIEPIPIAVISFENQTGDESNNRLSRIIPNLLITALEQSGRFQVVTWERLHDLLKQTGKDSIEFIDSDTGFELCRMEGITNLALGTIVKMGDIIATDLKILDVNTKEIVQTAQSRGEGDNSIYDQIDDLTSKIATGLGGLSEEKFTESHRPIMNVTTTSPDAYDKFIIGRHANLKYYWDDARRSLERAVQLDSTFAMAYLELSLSYFQLGMREARKNCVQKAKQFEYKVSEKEKLLINAAYAGIIESNPEKNTRILKEITRMFPKEKDAHIDLGIHYYSMNEYSKAIKKFHHVLDLDPSNEHAINFLSYVYFNIGEFEKSLEYLERYKSVSPGDPNPFDSAGDIYLQMGKLDKAIFNYKSAIALKPDFHSRHNIVYIYALLGNYQESLKWIDEYIQNSTSAGRKADGYWIKGFLFYLLDNKKDAIDALQTCEKFAQIIDNEYIRLDSEWLKFWINLDKEKILLGEKFVNSYFDKRKKAFENRNKFEQAESDFFYVSNLGLIYLKQSQIDSVRYLLPYMKSLLNDVRPDIKDHAEKTIDLFYVNVLAKEDSIQKARAVFNNVLPYNFFLYPPPSYLIYFAGSYLQDGIAQTHIKNGDFKSAISEYERLITFDPKNWHFIQPNYYYELAKLYEQQGSTKKAIENYTIYLDYGKLADQKRPKMIDAEKRLARLTNEN